MAEWTKARDSKSRIPKGIGGSNPSLSVSAFGGIDDKWLIVEYFLTDDRIKTVVKQKGMAKPSLFVRKDFYKLSGTLIPPCT